MKNQIFKFLLFFASFQLLLGLEREYKANIKVSSIFFKVFIDSKSMNKRHNRIESFFSLYVLFFIFYSFLVFRGHIGIWKYEDR